MKKIAVILILSSVIAFSGLNLSKVNSALQGIQRIEQSLAPTFYNGNRHLKIDKVSLTTKEKADILLFLNTSNTNKMLIVDSYKKLKKYKNSIGAIYLKKGRTQIFFIQERLRNRGFKVSKSFRNNLISECELSLLCLVKESFFD